VPYAHAKECLGLGSPYDFCIQIVETLNDAPLLNYTTASFAFASSTAKFTQIVSIYDGINYLPARLTVYVF
jgi:hypothetical protein